MGYAKAPSWHDPLAAFHTMNRKRIENPLDLHRRRHRGPRTADRGPRTAHRAPRTAHREHDTAARMISISIPNEMSIFAMSRCQTPGNNRTTRSSA